KGCKNCGYSFCVKCLTRKTAVPKLQGEVHHVCNKCFDILTGQSSHHQRMEALEQRDQGLPQDGSHGSNRPPSGGTKTGSKDMSSKYFGLRPEDRELVDRLEALKETGKPAHIPSEQEMAVRLAALKGEDPTSFQTESAKHKPFYVPPNRKTETEEMDDLLDEIYDEVELDSKYPKPEEDVANRLAALRGEPSNKSDQNMENNLDKPTIHQKMLDKNISTDKGSTTESGVSLDEMKRLIEQSANELEVDAQRALINLQRDKDLQAKLSELKKDWNKKTSEDSNVDDAAVVASSGANDENSDSENEEEAAKAIIKRAIEESRLDAEYEASGGAIGGDLDDDLSLPEPPTDLSEPTNSKGRPVIVYQQSVDELPWCCICNEDATIRCHDCDDDLYCNRCFKEGHRRFEMDDHEYSKYKEK
ncbi:unnamed protein product, partial [Owenia fusiformis]